MPLRALPAEKNRAREAMPKSVHTPAYRLFLRLLSEKRRQRRWSQRELGRRMEAHHAYVNMCENGERQLNIVELRQWCQALNISFPDFARQVDDALSLLEAEGVEAAASEPNVSRST